MPLNPLLFGFGIGDLTDPTGATTATRPAPAPWDLDSRYRVPVSLLLAATSYSLQLDNGVTQGSGTIATTASTDTVPPSIPAVLWHAGADNPNLFSDCATNRAELFGLVPSTDDQTPQNELRYSLASVLPDGGLALLYNELSPQALGDGGLVLAVTYGLEGLPGSYAVQVRDLAGNLSGPSQAIAVDIGPGCTFASSTTGRRRANLWAVLLLVVAFRSRARRRRC